MAADEQERELTPEEVTALADEILGRESQVDDIARVVALVEATSEEEA
jgi:hypothetical protein